MLYKTFIFYFISGATSCTEVSLIEKDQKMKATLLLLSILALSYNSISQSLLADEKFQMDGINEVDIRGSFCEVEITGQSDQTLYFDGWIRGRSGKSYEIEYDRQGSLLKVWINSPRSSWGSIDCKLDLRIPKGIDVTVDNSSGSVRATSLGGTEFAH